MIRYSAHESGATAEVEHKIRAPYSGSGDPGVGAKYKQKLHPTRITTNQPTKELQRSPRLLIKAAVPPASDFLSIFLNLGGGEGEADLDLAVERVVGEDDAVLRRALGVRAALRAQADDARHVDRRFPERVVAGKMVVVQDPEDELVLRVGRGRVDLELEHLVPARVPPLVSGDAALALLAPVLHDHEGVQLP